MFILPKLSEWDAEEGEEEEEPLPVCQDPVLPMVEVPLQPDKVHPMEAVQHQQDKVHLMVEVLLQRDRVHPTEVPLQPRIGSLLMEEAISLLTEVSITHLPEIRL